MKKRILAIILAVMMLTLVLTSCSSGSTGTQTAETTESDINNEAETSQNEVAGETERSQIKDTLPADLKFNGESIRIVGRDDGAELKLELFSEEDTGDVVETAVYKRNMTIEERLGISIEPLFFESTIHDGSKVISAIKSSVLAGSDDYDIFANQMSQSTALILDNFLINLKNLKYLDFDQPWWVHSFMEQLTVNDKCFMMAGDISLSMTESMYLMYYNKDMYTKNFGSDDMYEIVRNGDWTMDKLLDVTKAVYSDVNGDGEADIDDIYGYATTKIRFVDALLGGSGISIAERDSQGMPEFKLEQNPKTFTFVEKVNKLIYAENRSCPVASSADGEIDMLKRFAAGQLMIIPFTPMGAASLRDMTDNFGVIPIPKLDSDMKDYTTTVHNGFSAFGIIQTTKNSDIAAAVCEAMCAENYRTVTPAYYEVALKVKYSRDDETSQMLDMIRDSITFDFGYIYSGVLDSVMQQFRDLVQKNSNDVASALAKKMESAQKKLEELLTKYDELK